MHRIGGERWLQSTAMDEAFICRLFEIITRKTAAKVGGTEAYAAAIMDLERANPELRNWLTSGRGMRVEEKMANDEGI